MSRTPQKALAKVQYYENHIAPWTTNAVAIGTTAATVTTLTTKTTAARTAYNAQQVAKQAAEAATEAFHNAVAAMGDVGQGILKQIDTMAITTANPNVYALAQIPARKTPTGAGDPGTPYGFSVEVNTNGSLGLKWKNSNAVGSVYQIYRKLGATGEWENLGGVGRKQFTDVSVPAGTATVQYQIQATRPTGVSEWAAYTVNLGVANNLPQVTQGTPAKIAA